MGRVKEAIQRRQRVSHGGAGRRAHEEVETERLLAKGMAVLGMPPERSAKTPKDQREKQVLAWWLCEQTTVTRRWVAERLKTGHESRVAQALHLGRCEMSDDVAGMKATLARCLE